MARKIKTIKNPPVKDILAVVLNDEIYDRHTEDTDPPKGALGRADFSGWTVFGGYVEGKIASLFMVQGGQLHFYCLKAYRAYARGFLNSALARHKKTVFCEIPVLYRSVINFAKKGGFKNIEIKSKAWLKRGVFYDVEVMQWAV